MEKIALTLAELIRSGITAPGTTETQTIVEILTPQFGQRRKPAVDVVEVTTVKCKVKALIYRKTASSGTTRSGLERPQQIQLTQYAGLKFANHAHKLLNSKVPALMELELTLSETHAPGMMLTQEVVEDSTPKIGNQVLPVVHAEEAQRMKYKETESVMNPNSQLTREVTIAPGIPGIQDSVVFMTMMTSELRSAALVKATLQTMILLIPQTQTMKLRNLQMMSLLLQLPLRYAVAK